MKRRLGVLSASVILACLLATPCGAGDVDDYLTKDGKLKASLMIQYAPRFLATPRDPKGEVCVIEPTGEWTKKVAATKGKLSAKQLAALGHFLAAQDFNSLPGHQGYEPGGVHDGFYVLIRFDKKNAMFSLKNLTDPRTDYLPKPGDAKAAAWSRFVAVELFLADLLRASEIKDKNE